MPEAEHSIGQVGPEGGTDALRDASLISASGRVCLADFTSYPSKLDYSGINAQAAGVVECEAIECFFNGGREIIAEFEGDNASQVAAVRVRSRARRQMSYECADWISETGNIGKQIPDERLPENLRRVQTPSNTSLIGE